MFKYHEYQSLDKFIESDGWQNLVDASPRLCLLAAHELAVLALRAVTNLLRLDCTEQVYALTSANFVRDTRLD